MAEHPELSTPERAAARLTHDTLVHVVRRPGQLRAVRVSVPADWDAVVFADAMRANYAARGWQDVEVTVVPTEGEPRVLSVVT